MEAAASSCNPQLVRPLDTLSSSSNQIHAPLFLCVSYWSYSSIRFNVTFTHMFVFFFQAVPSPKNLNFTSRPFKPTALTICGSPGARSIAWSLHLTISPSASRTTPLTGLFAESVTLSPSSEMSALRPRAATSGNLMNLNGSGLQKLSIHQALWKEERQH